MLLSEQNSGEESAYEPSLRLSLRRGAPEMFCQPAPIPPV